MHPRGLTAPENSYARLKLKHKTVSHMASGKLPEVPNLNNKGPCLKLRQELCPQLGQELCHTIGLPEVSQKKYHPTAGKPPQNDAKRLQRKDRNAPQIRTALGLTAKPPQRQKSKGRLSSSSVLPQRGKRKRKHRQ
ncbi:unnamed protein product [Linum trigynum]|uniref:Uncharacterized protein n=1 Tax=Linum trigynum TaxID=586398 RepID=A0AAV2G7S9_9ROSI